MSPPGQWKRLRPYVFALYIAVVATCFLYFNMRLTIEWVVLILFMAAVVSGRGLLFVRDWGAFIAVLLAWQLASGIAANSTFPWHIQELIDADKFMFAGHVPSQWLQQHLYHPGVLEPWDIFAATMYMLHFLVPLLCGFVLWCASRELFQRFAVTFVLVAMAGFVTYILFPAVPPWMAAQSLVHVHHKYIQAANGHVYLPHVQNLFNITIDHWFSSYHGDITIGALHAGYDQVAAVPSEHAAYPMLFFLFLRRQFGRWAHLAWIYIGALLFSITYLGQHYVIDALVGFAYAGIGYALVMQVAPALVSRYSARKPVVSKPARPHIELEEA